MRETILLLMIVALIFILFSYIATSQFNATSETQAIFDTITYLLKPFFFIAIALFIIWMVSRWIF